VKKKTKKTAGKKNAAEKKVFRGGENSPVCENPCNPSMVIGAKRPSTPPKVQGGGDVEDY
jgi:hypothetical protein